MASVGIISRIRRCPFYDLRAGTDATIAQHIETIINREYVVERMEGRTKYLVPSSLGMGLIEGYDKIEFEKSLSKPQLRREVIIIFIGAPGQPLMDYETERDMVQVCQGTKSKAAMLEEAIVQYKDIFMRVKNGINNVLTVSLAHPRYNPASLKFYRAFKTD